MMNFFERQIIRLLERAGSLLSRQKRTKQKNPRRDRLLLSQANSLYQPKRKENIYLSTQERLQHLYILGATGSGKTKLIEFLIRQDILSGRGLCLIDPHGDLYQNILKFLGELLLQGVSPRIAKHIRNKLVLIEPSNLKWTMGFNPLEAENINHYTQTLEFMGIFKRLWADAYWGPRMEELLRNTLMTLSFNGLTLLEAKALLTDSAFREQLVANMSRTETREYWLYRYNQLSEKMQATYREPILNRLSIFVSDPFIRSMVGQIKSTIDFRKIMDQGKWLLVNLSKGQLKGNASLLGALIIAKFQLSALSRVDLPEERRIPFFLFVDEFQNFLGDDFETILSEARKYGLGLVLAHQNIDQLDRQLRSAILGNTLTQVFFRLSSQDATTLSSELSHKEKPIIQRRLIDLKVGEAYLKKKGERPRLMKTVFVSKPEATAKAVEIVKTLSFSLYGRQRQEVEEELARRAKIIYSIGQNDSVGDPQPDSYAGQFAPQGEIEEAYEW
jgi:type IV secretory pathway VirB4 component